VTRADPLGIGVPKFFLSPAFRRFVRTRYWTPYLDNDAITDQDGKAIANQSSTLWFLGCDPNVRASHAMGFLNGNQTPFFRAKEADVGILGTAFESFMDFGVGEEDPYCLQMNTGA
jgi:hypothetical protein